MARISQIELKQLPKFHTLTIRKEINFMQEFSDFSSYSFAKITNYLNSLNKLASGAPIVCFHNMDLEYLDVEIGFPVASPLKDKDDIVSNTIPSQKVVTAIDLGPYEKQDPTLKELFTWIQRNGYKMQGKIYYQYLNNIEFTENEFLTMMILPIK
jgi:effector-binding domain-containing protein